MILYAVRGVLIPGQDGDVERYIRGMAGWMEGVRRGKDVRRCTGQIRFQRLHMSEWVGIVGGWAYRVCGN